MDPKTPAFQVAPPPTPHPAQTAANLQQEGVDRQRAAETAKLDFAYAVLKNSGIDTDCGACMEVAFTGVTTNTHTCAKRDEISAVRAELTAAKTILKDLVVAGVLTDGFMTVGVGQSLLNQAEIAKKFLEAHP